jgi:methylated-DNA-[protein]-cysteine S-methyltransferase
MDDVVAARTLAGPFGPYHVAATDRGIVGAEWLTTEEAFLHGVRARLVGRRIDRRAATARLGAAIPVLEALLRGDRADASTIEVDLDDRPAWDQRVLAAVRELRWGETASYGGIARRIGAPRAARAVGGALGRNPITLLIPCHRVIAGDGTLGGYGSDGWGDGDERLALKASLLLREGRAVARRAG